mmetsp:Transcript_4039/g.8170  ORF Transcript_4039/g.8170 Transcript_4039/m.8170 type:complete len:93 (+) Transcript_4039:32-310(+)
MTSFVESVLVGALTKGINRPTVVFINGSLVMGVALISASLSSGDLPQDVALHFIVLLLLMLGLLASFNWYVIQTGTESVVLQKKELGLDAGK